MDNDKNASYKLTSQDESIDTLDEFVVIERSNNIPTEVMPYNNSVVSVPNIMYGVVSNIPTKVWAEMTIHGTNYLLNCYVPYYPHMVLVWKTSKLFYV